MAAGAKKPAGGKSKDGKAKAGGGSHAWHVLLLAVIVAAFAFLSGIQYEQGREARAVTPPAPAPAPQSAAHVRPLDQPVRAAPAHFPPDSCLPAGKEFVACGPVNPATFSPGRDLMRFEDPRVWFESDHGHGHEDDDHTIHRCLEEPFRRLVELAAKRGAQIKDYDGYRPNGVHRNDSLHREGRAIDITAEGIPLEELAKLCWQAGFDWVFYENSVKSGAHIHCSVRRGAIETSAMPPATTTNNVP